MEKSLQSSINLIKSGARRRVGSGEDVKVWKDPWLPNSHPFITTTPIERLEDWPVSALKSVQRNSWDKALLNAVFYTRDINLIRSISLTLRSTVYGWWWNLEQKGIYSVKNGYGVTAYQGDNLHERKGWTLIWKLKIPGKIRNLMWRTGANLLPTKLGLCSKKIIVDPLCPCRHTALEDLSHAQLTCPEKKDLWDSVITNNSDRTITDFMAWWEDLYQHESD